MIIPYCHSNGATPFGFLGYWISYLACAGVNGSDRCRDQKFVPLVPGLFRPLLPAGPSTFVKTLKGSAIGGARL